MQIYLVGGAVRDQLLGLPVKERDWVVVGATPEVMLAQGFIPVGKDFPVFLHPQTKEEYALARTERKVAPGYQGFHFYAAPEVTLAQDLARRDLTINAIAQDEQGQLIDPYGGQADLQARRLRHVSPAFVEDPVRLLRLGRFAARFANHGFYVVDETMALLQGMVQAGEVDALVPDRVWRELTRGFAEAAPHVMLAVLRESGAYPILLPQWHGCGDEAALARAVSVSDDALVRMAAFSWQMSETELADFIQRYPLSKVYMGLLRLVVREAAAARSLRIAQPAAILAFLQQADAFRRAERFQAFLVTLQAIHGECFQLSDFLARAQVAAQHIDTQALLAQGIKGPAMMQAIHAERLKIIAAMARAADV